MTTRFNSTTAYRQSVQACAHELYAKLLPLGQATRNQLTLFASKPDASKVVNDAIRKLIIDGLIEPYKTDGYNGFRYRIKVTRAGA